MIFAPKELLHPELRDKSYSYLVLRSSMWSKWWYPKNEQIGWFGDVRMYMTLPQYEALGIKNESDIRVGPF
jgi:hypothetical protein